MFKKVLLAAATSVILISSTHALAGSFYAGPSISILDSITNSSGYRGVAPRLTLGYGDLGDGAYFAGEFFVIPTTAPITDTHFPGTQSAKMSTQFGASFIPGVVIGPQTLGFFRIGVITSKFTGPGAYKTGGQLGLGLMTAVSPEWDVRGEYNYSVYGGVGGIGSPKVDEFMLTFLYRFES